MQTRSTELTTKIVRIRPKKAGFWSYFSANLVAKNRSIVTKIGKKVGKVLKKATEIAAGS